MSTSTLNNQPSSKLLEAHTAFEVKEAIKHLPQDTIILVDIDDTIITPKSTTFRARPYNQIIDDIKKNKDQYHNYTEIVSNWRLQRKVMLLNEQWPEILESLKSMFQVYGLTKMDTGSFGNIPLIEEWRYQELKSLRIVFSNNISFSKYNINSKEKNRPVFYQGIFITGNASKADTIEVYKEGLKTSNIVMIDDRADHLKDIETFCRKESINFTGILFKGLEVLADKPNPAIHDLQKEYLINHAKWLEDEEALKMLQSKL